MPQLSRTVGAGAMLRVECNTCGALLELAPVERGAVCPYCATPTVVERPATGDRPLPAFTLGFALDREAAAAAARAYLRRHPLAPLALYRADVDAVRAVYLPAYLYGAAGRSTYSAQIGEDYEVEETVTTTDAQGNQVTEKRTRTETEWHGLSGEHACWVRDVLVTASRGVDNRELEAVQPFDLRSLRPYQPRLLLGFAAEEPSLDRRECAALARTAAEKSVRSRIGAFLPGDRHSGLRVTTRIEEESLDLVQLPLWVMSCRWAADRPPVRLLVNGQTGQVGGAVPVSATKITVLLLLAFAVLLLVLWLRGSW
jgi:hypothetical protein